MKKILSVLLALLTTTSLFCSCGAGSQGSSTNSSTSQGGDEMKRLDMALLADNIDEIAQYDMDNNKIFGSAYYVYQDGVAFEKCYGTASLNSDTPITNNSIFRLASMTKPVTAIAALILVENGLLSLDDTVDKYLPAFKDIKIIDATNNKTTPANLPTIRQLLNHTSGIACDATKLATMTDMDKKTLDASIAFYIKIGLDFEPGSKQAYSPYGAFDVLTKIIEIIRGTNYLNYLQEYLFEPCGMVDTTFTPNAEQQNRMVAMHTTNNGENAVAQMPSGCIFDNFPSTHYLGGAGLVSSLSDYGKFASFLLNKGKVGDISLLSEEMFNLLCTPQVEPNVMPGNARWGLGVRVITDSSYPYLPVGSFGWSGAYGSHFWIDPVNKIFAVFMKNSQVDGGAANESAVNFEKAVYSALA